MISRRATLGALIGATAPLAHRSFAQDNTIRLMVGASSGTDFTARLIAEKLRDALGRPVVVISGWAPANGSRWTNCSAPPPDGRTLLLATSAPFSIYPHIYSEARYDPLKDFTPIAGVSSFDVGIATGPKTGARDMGELVKWLNANRNDALYGSSPGTGSLSHFVGYRDGAGDRPADDARRRYKETGVGVIDL